METTLTELLETRRRLERAADALTRAARQIAEALDETRGLPVGNAVASALDLTSGVCGTIQGQAENLSERIEAIAPAEEEEDVDEYGDALAVAERPPQWEMI